MSNHNSIPLEPDGLATALLDPQRDTLNLIEEMGDLFEYGSLRAGITAGMINTLIHFLVMPQSLEVKEPLLNSLVKGAMRQEYPAESLDWQLVMDHAGKLDEASLEQALVFLGTVADSTALPFLQVYLSHNNPNISECASEAIEEIEHRNPGGL